jgi:hypothetical protein
MTSPTLLSLAGRVESLTGRDRNIANDVLYACGWTTHEIGEGDNRTTIWTAPRGEEFTDGDQPDPTASLDAAMTLVPEGWGWSVGDVHGPLEAYSGSSVPWAEIWTRDDRDVQIPDMNWDGCRNHLNAATPALALTAASLRARSALEASHG